MARSPEPRANQEHLRARWADATEFAAIIEQLADRGIDFQTVAAQAGKPAVDPFDLLCQLAFNAPILTRRQRAERVRQKQRAFFTFYAPEAREILNDLLEKYAADGELQFTRPDVLKAPPSPNAAMSTKSRPASAAQTNSAPPSTNSNRCCMRLERSNRLWSTRKLSPPENWRTTPTQSTVRLLSQN